MTRECGRHQAAVAPHSGKPQTTEPVYRHVPQGLLSGWDRADWKLCELNMESVFTVPRPPRSEWAMAQSSGTRTGQRRPATRAAGAVISVRLLNINCRSFPTGFLVRL